MSVPNVRESSGTAFLYAASSVHGKRRKANPADTLSVKRTWRVRVRLASRLFRPSAEWFRCKLDSCKNRNADEQGDNNKHVLGGYGHFSYQKMLALTVPVSAAVITRETPLGVPAGAMMPRKSITVGVFAG